MRISDWSSDVCSSDLSRRVLAVKTGLKLGHLVGGKRHWAGRQRLDKVRQRQVDTPVPNARRLQRIKRDPQNLRHRRNGIAADQLDARLQHLALRAKLGDRKSTRLNSSH